MKKIKKVLLFTHEKYQNKADIQKITSIPEKEKRLVMNCYYKQLEK